MFKDLFVKNRRFPVKLQFVGVEGGVDGGGGGGAGVVGGGTPEPQQPVYTPKEITEEHDIELETAQTTAAATVPAETAAEETAAAEETLADWQPAGETMETQEITLATEPPVVEEKAGFLDSLMNGGWLYLAIGLGIGLVLLVIKSIMDANKRKQQAERKKRARDQKIHTFSKEYQEIQGSDMPAAAPAAAAEPAAAAVPAAAPAPAVVPTTAVSAAGGVKAAVFQHIGAREDQQDSYGMTQPGLYYEQGVLALVADGMGGLSNGKAVSSTLVNTFLAGFEEVKAHGKPQEILLDLAIRANYVINEQFGDGKRSGSTLVSLIIRDGYLYFLTVGDSHIYLYRDGMLLQLNREHIYQEELALKAINRKVSISQVSSDRQAKALTSFFGIGVMPYMDRCSEGIKLKKGDRLLLCSDGVFGTLSQGQMEQALQREVSESAAMMRDMILKVQKPYQDNNTGLILEYLG